ncbi:hypothetical protein ACFWR9_42120 [Streptomyces sp. NPDC058534]|uniref:hypothetical protein n=1 Tax=Streptomyces sp. NPDC058534 TaxID=3346541 RepID=UPI00366211EF
MSQQYPQQPNQPQQPGPYGQQPPPGYGYPPQPGYGHPGGPAPRPPKKSSAGKIVGFGCLGVVALLVLVGIGAAVGGGSSDDATDTSNKDKAVAADDKPKADDSKEAPAKQDEKPAAKKSQAEEFQACVAKSGTGTEKTAVKHVTKVTGTDKKNNILDAAEVFTDYTGGLLGPHQGDGKLIASAFASCYESENGLVTVYDKDGEVLANGNY